MLHFESDVHVLTVKPIMERVEGLATAGTQLFGA